jgi:preprotein translocase subunit SecF
MKIDFLRFRKIYYIFSGILIAASIASLFVFGLKAGIDFTGGSVLEIEFKDVRPTNQEIESVLAKLNLGDVVVQPTGDKGVIIKMPSITEETHQEILKQFSDAQEKQFEFIGPSVGQELKQTTIKALFLALMAIAIYIAFAFRKISRPIPSWQYGIATIIGLTHNILIPLGVFAYLGKFYNIEITIPIISALLTILGFSVHDNIVIFDRIRENLLKRGDKSFEEVVNFSLNQTLGRSINTVLTVLFVLFAILILGGETLRYFSLALIIGITFGAYSSIFIASPLLVSWYKKPKKIDKKS